jgi:hypothetical protein
MLESSYRSSVASPALGVVARALRLGSCALLASALACGSSRGSGGTTSVGGEGNEDPQGTGNTGNTGNASGGQAAGDLASVWRQATGQISVLDSQAPGPPEIIDFDIPATVTDPQYDAEVELFQQLKDEQLVLYAHYGDADVYYRVTRPATESDGGFVVDDASSVSVFTLDDGVLTQQQTRSIGSKVVFATITFQKYDADFPPADWPSEVVELDAAGVEP